MERVEHLKDRFRHVLFHGHAGAECARVRRRVKNNRTQTRRSRAVVQGIANLAHHRDVKDIERRPHESKARDSVVDVESNVLKFSSHVMAQVVNLLVSIRLVFASSQPALLHSFQCTVVQYCGSKSLLSSATLARRSEYSSVVTVLPSTVKITSGAIQPPSSFTYLLNCVSCVCAPSLPAGRIIRTKYKFFLSIQNCGECRSP